MNTNFSLHRIKLLLLADWIEYKKSFMLAMGVLFLVIIAISFIGQMGSNSQAGQATIFILGGLITFVYYCRHIGRKIHQPKGLYYTLPASNEEKYFTILLESLVYFISFLIVFWLAMYVRKLFAHHFNVLSISELYIKTNGIGILLFFSSLLFLSHMTFKKHPMLIGFAGIAAFQLLFITVMVKVFPSFAEIYNPYFISSFVSDTFMFLFNYMTPILLICTIVVLYVGYLKLKEKELR